MHLSDNRIGAVCALAGAALLLAGTWLHPMPADPNDAVQSFAAYAGDRLWVTSHLAQLAGIALALAALYGVALLDGRAYPRWLGGLALAGGVPTALSGVAMGFAGFSDLEMTINMPASAVLLLWTFALGALMWRRDRRPSGAPAF